MFAGGIEGVFVGLILVEVFVTVPVLVGVPVSVGVLVGAEVEVGEGVCVGSPQVVIGLEEFCGLLGLRRKKSDALLFESVQLPDTSSCLS
jgi:hypothetical protein